MPVPEPNSDKRHAWAINADHCTLLVRGAALWEREAEGTPCTTGLRSLAPFHPVAQANDGVGLWFSQPRYSMLHIADKANKKERKSCQAVRP